MKTHNEVVTGVDHLEYIEPLLFHFKDKDTKRE